MKTLIVLRHGKAEESAVGGDKKRALKGRGRRDAEAMGVLIGELARPDLVVSSDAGAGAADGGDSVGGVRVRG